jgi:transcriptional regulator with XRE-family HTH domain
MERAEIRSLNHLAERTGIAVQTITRLVHGEGEPTTHTLESVAAVFKPADARQVARWAGQQWTEKAPRLPDAARHLTPKQWASVVAVINSMADPGSTSSGTVTSLRSAEAHQPADDGAAERDPGAKAARRRRRPSSDDPDQIS